MTYEVILTELIKKEAKKLAKKYPKIKDDLKDLERDLKVNPFIGLHLDQIAIRSG